MAEEITGEALVKLAQVGQGPILAGTYLNLILFGVSVTQVYYYYGSYRSDRRWIQIFIVVLFLLDLLNSIFNMIYIYNVLVNHFGELSVLANANWLFSMGLWLTGVIGAMVQGFFAWRVHVLTRNKWAAALVFSLAAIEGLAGVGSAIAASKIVAFGNFERANSIVIVWLAGSATCDVLVTVILVWYLRGHKTGYNSDDIVDRIIRLTVQTGAVTSVVSCVDLILFLVFPLASYHLAFNMMLSKLYTNSLLSSLNARNGWAFSSGSHPSDKPSGGVNISGGPRSGGRRDNAINLSQLQSTTTRPQVFVSVDRTNDMHGEGGSEYDLADKADATVY